jgi:hypothetical protein
MAASKDVRGCLIWAALACLVLQSGCARYRDWLWKTSGPRTVRTAPDDPTQEPIDSLNINHGADDAAASAWGQWYTPTRR